jgi:hypothetical protein
MLKKVQPGSPLSIPAADYNAFIDAALECRRHMVDSGGPDTQSSSLSAGMVLVRNNTGGSRSRFDILGVDTPAILPSVNESAFAERVALKGVAPALSLHAGRFVVLAEPLTANQVGRAFVHGVCPVKVDVPADATSLSYTEMVDAVYANLKSSQEGSARILWRAGGTGVQWALVHLGAGRSNATIRFGRATADWSAGNSISLTPCLSSTNATATGEGAVTVTIISPSTASPQPIIKNNDILAFISFTNWAGQRESVLLPVPVKGLPAGTGQRKVLQLDAANQPFWGYVEAI